MDSPRIRLFVVLVLCPTWPTLAAEPNPARDHLITTLKACPIMRDKPSDPRSRNVQFEYQVSFPAGAAPYPIARLLVERRHDRVNGLLCSGRGLPIAFYGDRCAYVFPIAGEERLQALRPTHFSLMWDGSQPLASELKFGVHETPSGLSVNLFDYFERNLPDPLKEIAHNRLFESTSPRGTKIRFRVSPIRPWSDFPLESIEMESPEGHVLRIGTFVPADQAEYCLAQFDLDAIELMAPDGRGVASMTALKELVHPSRLRRPAKAEDFDAARSWFAKLGKGGQLPPPPPPAVVLTESLPDEPAAAKPVLEPLEVAIEELVVVPSTQIASYPPRYSSVGFSRTRAFARFEAWFGPDRAAKAIEVLVQGAADTHRDTETRILCLNILTRVGLPPFARAWKALQHETEAAANGAQGKAGSASEFDAACSGAALILGQASVRDISIAAKGAMQSKYSLPTRTICLEGLCLAQNVSGLDDGIAELVQCAASHQDLRRQRLASALMHIPAARLRMLKAAVASDDRLLLTRLLQSCEVSLDGRSPDRDEILSVARDIALDRSRPPANRRAAACLVETHQEGRPFATAFLKSVIDDNGGACDAALEAFIPVHLSMLTTDPGGFGEKLTSKAPPEYLRAAAVIHRLVTRPWLAETERASVHPLIRTMLAHRDDRVALMGVNSLLYSLQAGDHLPAELLKDLTSLIRRTGDPTSIAAGVFVSSRIAEQDFLKEFRTPAGSPPNPNGAGGRWWLERRTALADAIERWSQQ